MVRCDKCANAIFIPWFGEYKCNAPGGPKYEAIVYDIDVNPHCLYFKEGEPKDTLNSPEDDAK